MVYTWMLSMTGSQRDHTTNLKITQHSRTNQQPFHLDTLQIDPARPNSQTSISSMRLVILYVFFISPHAMTSLPLSFYCSAKTVQTIDLKMFDFSIYEFNTFSQNLSLVDNCLIYFTGTFRHPCLNFPDCWTRNCYTVAG